MTTDDSRMLKYFIENYGDPTRWCDWDKRKEVLIAELPSLGDYLMAKRTLKAHECILFKILEDMDTDDEY